MEFLDFQSKGFEPRIVCQTVIKNTQLADAC